MSLLQVHIDPKLHQAIQNRAKKYGVPKSSIVKIALTEAFLTEEAGNIFNAERDNQGQGIELNTLLQKI